MLLFSYLLMSGITTGALYALVALGFVVVNKATGIINFAQGEFFMIGAYVLWVVLGATHNYALGFVAAAIVVAIGGGLLLLLITQPLLEKAHVLVLLATLGVSLIVQQLAQNVFGGDAISTLIRFAFDEMNLEKLRINIFEYNERAKHVLEERGFVQEGRLVAYSRKATGYEDELLMSVWLD